MLFRSALRPAAAASQTTTTRESQIDQHGRTTQRIQERKKEENRKEREGWRLQEFADGGLVGGEVELARLPHRTGWPELRLAGLGEETRKGGAEGPPSGGFRRCCVLVVVGSLRPPPSPLCFIWN